jgi:cell division protein FtsZ
VIDPDMTDQIRVTVVATGIGRAAAKSAQPPVAVVSAPGRRGRGPFGTATDYDVPPHMRNRAQRVSGHDVAPSFDDESTLDIPAFLRRQAD